MPTNVMTSGIRFSVNGAEKTLTSKVLRSVDVSLANALDNVVLLNMSNEGARENLGLIVTSLEGNGIKGETPITFVTMNAKGEDNTTVTATLAEMKTLSGLNIKVWKAPKSRGKGKDKTLEGKKKLSDLFV